MKKSNILYLFLAMVYTAVAQEPKQKTIFNLNEAVAYAKVHNRNIQNASASIQAAEEQKWEAISIGLPQLNGQIDYNTNIKTPFETSGGDNELLNFMFPKHGLTPTITVSQLIFDGSYIVGLQASKVFLDISKNTKEKTDNEIEQIVVNAYMTTLLTNESILISEKNIKNVEGNLREATAVFENGLGEEESVEQLQLTLATLENTIRNYRVLADVSNGYVKLLLGIDTEITIILNDDLENLIHEYITLESNYNQNSIFNNVDYKIAVNDSESQKLFYKLEKAKYLPSISAYLNTNWVANNDSFSEIFQSEQDWMGTVSAGVTLKIPIFTSFNIRSQKRRAKINWEISENSLKDTEQQLKLDLKKVKSEYTLATQTYENRKQNLALAEKIERKNSIKFKEGMTTSIELRSVQVQLYTSQQEYIESIIDVINKKVELKNLLNIK
ncbi:TolC family protein [Flavicella sp.]|uniref:TolC family protein n=1 Tax=Flavicella sp. TaxID=2957742 RepID=UPI00301A5327